MNNEQITALTLLLLHTYQHTCRCEFMPAQALCSRCLSLERAEQQFPLIYEAFISTMEKMEAAQ
jgi:hypothetical protein